MVRVALLAALLLAIIATPAITRDGPCRTESFYVNGKLVICRTVR